jgi:AraC-like DNA-binding protein
LKLLEQNPMYPLDELADAVGLSYDRMSHLFSATMGLPLRSYQLSRKVNAAAQLAYSGLSLTEVAHEAGFSDSSHFSRVWLKAFGASPSFFFGGQYVDVKLEVKEP